MRTAMRLSFSFATSGPTAGRPNINTVCCYPLSARLLTPYRRLTSWALEYHARPAGLVHFKARPGRPLLREAGTVHLYAPGCVYREDTREADPHAQETYWLFTGGDAAGLHAFLDKSTRFARFLDPEHLVGDLLLESAQWCSTRGAGAFWMVQSLLAAAVFHLSASRPAEGGDHLISSSAPHRRFGDEVDLYLRRHLSESVSLAALARQMRTSPSRLSHTFRAEMGIAPMARLRALRIDHAKRLLLKGETLKSIAAVTGHSSEYHLSRNFKAVTGQSPRDYRNAPRPHAEDRGLQSAPL